MSNSDVRAGMRVALLAVHAAVVALSFWLAWLLRFDFAIPAREMPVFRHTFLIAEVAKVFAFVVLGGHLQRWWRHLGLGDMMVVFRNNLIASTLAAVSIFMAVGWEFPRSVYLIDLLLCFLLTGGLLFTTRIYSEVSYNFLRQKPGGKGLLIYGAGVAGIALARELRGNPNLGYRVLGFLDDDPRKQGTRVLGFPVLGTGHQTGWFVERSKNEGPEVEEIVVAMPSATGAQIRAAVARGKAAGVACRVVPGLGELISGRLSVDRMREVSVTDILGRDPVELDLESVRRTIEGCPVLVTGAAGSIGSELCRQIAAFEPSKLIAFDQAETELFHLEAALRHEYPHLNLVAEVGDIRDPQQVEHAIRAHAVQSIYHAAAYKHVPMMERQICEAVRNNVLGTWNLVQAAWRANVSNFLLISTDKAVNPTSIMGLTKRVAELLVSVERSEIGRGPGTHCVAVRFGNVLVSNGSVVPTFQKQIAAGGPVTVTHPDMQRYFMTVREAAQLVLQASTMGQGSEIYVLDMGTPVKIVDLARRMIELAGFVPDEDIEIRYTGLRPGEKMFEELALIGEDILETSHPKIRIFQGLQLTLQEISPWVAELQHLVWKRDAERLIAHMRLLVPEYRPGFATAPPRTPKPPAVERRSALVSAGSTKGAAR
jgi:FlaA1/EpsC-like NDP-sugar epimerase